MYISILNQYLFSSANESNSSSSNEKKSGSKIVKEAPSILAEVSKVNPEDKTVEAGPKLVHVCNTFYLLSYIYSYICITDRFQTINIVCLDPYGLAIILILYLYYLPFSNARLLHRELLQQGG